MDSGCIGTLSKYSRMTDYSTAYMMPLNFDEADTITWNA